MPTSDSRLLYLRHIKGQGVGLFQEVCRHDLEGIVAKWKHGAYVSGDVTSWVKVKNPAYSQAVGRWERFQRKPGVEFVQQNRIRTCTLKCRARRVKAPDFSATARTSRSARTVAGQA